MISIYPWYNFFIPLLKIKVLAHLTLETPRDPLFLAFLWLSKFEKLDTLFAIQTHFWTLKCFGGASLFAIQTHICDPDT